MQIGNFIKGTALAAIGATGFAAALGGMAVLALTQTSLVKFHALKDIVAFLQAHSTASTIAGTALTGGGSAIAGGTAAWAGYLVHKYDVESLVHKYDVESNDLEMRRMIDNF